MSIEQACNSNPSVAYGCSVCYADGFTGVSVVNRVSSMSDDATFERGRSILHRTLTAADSPGEVRATTLYYAQAHLLYEYTTNPRLDRYLQSNSKQPKTYKALYQSVNTNCHTRTFVTESMTVIFTMVIMYWSIPHNLFS